MGAVGSKITEHHLQKLTGIIFYRQEKWILYRTPKQREKLDQATESIEQRAKQKILIGLTFEHDRVVVGSVLTSKWTG